MRTRILAPLLAFSFILATAATAQTERWDRDLGKPAPRLYPAGWVGTPVSLDALRKSDANAAAAATDGTVARKAEISGGNAVVIAFWNADIPC